MVHKDTTKLEEEIARYKALGLFSFTKIWVDLTRLIIGQFKNIYFRKGKEVGQEWKGKIKRSRRKI